MFDRSFSCPKCPSTCDGPIGADGVYLECACSPPTLWARGEVDRDYNYFPYKDQAE